MIRLFAYPVSLPLKGEGCELLTKNNSSEDRRDGTNGYFRWNFGCSAEQKTLKIVFRTLPQRKQLEIPFRGTNIEANSWNSVQTLPQKRKQLGITFRGTKIEANSRWNSVPRDKYRSKLSEFVLNHSAEEKTTWNYVLCIKNRSKLSECRSEPFPEEKTTRNSVPCKKNRSKLLECHAFRTIPWKIKQQNVAAKNFKKVSEKTTFEVRTNQFVKLFCLFCKTNFFRGISFRSEL
jgi:hypothetical protein